MRRKLIGFLTALVWAVVIGCVLGGLGGWILARSLHIPQLDQLPAYHPATTSAVFDSEGRKVAVFATERRVELPPQALPNSLKLAIVAAEDAKFYEHGGVDPKAILRALIGSIKTGKIGGMGGGSTLTQQLALALFLEREHTITRKVKEMFLAMDMEKRLSKDQIITMYANQIFLGHGAYGAEAASRLYFGSAASELSLAQSALLAGMIPSANNKFDPIGNPEGARKRRDFVLDRMAHLGFIRFDEAEAAKKEELGAELHRKNYENGSYFLEHVRQLIEKSYGTKTLYTSGLQIDITMHEDLQKAAEKAVREGLVRLETTRLGYRRPPNLIEQGKEIAKYRHPSWAHLEIKAGDMVFAVVDEVSRKSARLHIGERAAELDLKGAKWTRTSSLKRILKTGDLVLVRIPKELPETEEAVLKITLLQEPKIEGALLAMDNRTGAVLAMVGGFDFQRSKFNRAIQSKLQCGSAFKPFVYLTAFKQGFTPADTLFDAPFLLPDGSGEMTYCPKNYHGEYYGITTLRRALELSFNATAVKLQDLIGGDAVVQTARDLGISTELHPYPSLALGTLGVRLIDLVRAYSGFANLGEIPEPYFISEVRDREGKPLQHFYPMLERKEAQAVSYLLVHVLEGVIQRGTGMKARGIKAHLAGKTGTTDDYSDAWFLGFSPRVTVGVWVGRDHKAPIGKKMTGAAAALPIWIDFVEAYLETLDEEAREEKFPVPAGIVFSVIDWYTGHLVVPSCSGSSRPILEAFLDESETTVTCEGDDPTFRDLPWLFQQPHYTPRPNEAMPSPDAIACVDQRFKDDEIEAEKKRAGR